MRGSVSPDAGLATPSPHGGAGVNPASPYVVDGADKAAVWLTRFGVEYAHDRADFGEECCKALGISAGEAEALRLELLARSAA